MQIFIKSPVKFEGIHYLFGSQNIEDNLALRMVLAGVATKVVGDDQVIEINGVFDSNNNFKGIENPITKALIPVGTGGGSAPNIQTLTSAQATSPGINISSGANIVKISPAISADSTFVITGGSFGDSLTLIVPQDATGGRNLTFENIDFGAGVALTTIAINLTYDGTNWILINNPIWS